MAGKGVQLGFLKYVLGFDTLAFKKGISDADADLVKLQRNFAAKGKEFQKLGKSLTAFVTLPLAGIAAAGIKEAQETAAAMAQVNASLASMGPVAGRTAKQLEAAANAFETKSLYEADQVLKDVTAQMLTFGNISGKVFDDAQQAAIDLATKFGKDLPSATILVGKALNDPIKGLTALQRVGVQFTESQRDQIKAMVEAGNVAGAQAVIMAELKREIGGAAEAAQNADPWNKLSDSFKSIAESIGTVLLPIIPPLANALASVAQWVSSLDPTTQKWVVGIGATAAALGPLLIVLGSVTTAISSLGPIVLALTKGWGLLTAGLTALAPVIGIVGRALLGLLANPLLLGAAVLITGIYLAWKHWDEIGPIVQRVVTAVQTWIQGKLTGVLNAVLKPINAVTGAFRNMWDKVVGHSYVPDMVQAIADEFGRLGQIMVDPAVRASDKVAAAFQGLANVASQVFGRKAGGIFGAIANAVSALAPLLGGVKIGAPSFAPWDVGVSTGNTVPFTPRAMGGPVVPGKMYRVGENGPEYVSFGRAGYVHPGKGANDGGGRRLTIVPSKYFDVVVQDQATRVAAPMAAHAAVGGAVGGFTAVQRKRDRTFP